MNIIRKISVGSNYKEAMHYVLGQKVFGGRAIVHLIVEDKDDQKYRIWVRRGEDELIEWKAWNFNMPISVEYDIDF